MRKVRCLLFVLLLMLVAAAAAAATGNSIVGWGAGTTNSGIFPDFGQALEPQGLTGIQAVAAGQYHSVAIRQDGTVVAWGDNRLLQTNVPAGLSNIISAATWDHTLALGSDGTVTAWGDNAYGRANVPLGLSNVVAIGVGALHSLAVRGDGTVVAWGAGLTNTGSGRVDRGQSAIPDSLTNVVAVDGGACHSLALRADGTVAAWGAGRSYTTVYPDYGQSTVPAGLRSVAAISAGGYHNLALRSNGTVVAWGYNGSGATNVPPGLLDVVAISAGEDYSLALRRDGSVIGWGVGFYQPQSVPDGLSNVVAISAGGGHSLALVHIASPEITLQPQDQVTTEGSSVSLVVTASGSPHMTYQWQKDGADLVEGGNISGTTTATLTLTNITIEQSGYYTVLVGNEAGSAISTPALVEVRKFLCYADGQLLSTNQATFLRSTSLEFQGPFAGGWIIYTLDGSDPAVSGISYEGPFTLTQSATLRIITYSADFAQSYAPPPLQITIVPAFTLSAFSSGGGTVSVTPSNSPIAGGTLAQLTAMPDAGCSFLEWRGDAAGTNPITTVLMTRDKMAQAIFGTTVATSIVGTGSVQFEPAAEVYPFGTMVMLTPLPASNSYFLSWAGALSGSSAPAPLAITNALPTVTAAFAALTPGYSSLTVVSDGHGHVAVSPSTNRYPLGQQVVLTAVPDAWQTFQSWSGDATGAQTPLTITLNQDATIIAHFSRNPLVCIEPPLDGLQDDFIRFTVLGERDTVYSVLASTNMEAWEAVGSVTNRFGEAKFDDIGVSTHAQRFYRAQQTGP